MKFRWPWHREPCEPERNGHEAAAAKEGARHRLHEQRLRWPEILEAGAHADEFAEEIERIFRRRR